MNTPPCPRRFRRPTRCDRPAGRSLRVALLLLVAGPAVGCTRYEFDVVAPADLAQPVGTKQWVTAGQDPLEYRLLTVENRLVMQIHNPTADAVQLLGDRSVVVDPRGQSHALRSQTIAPDSFVKLILPPMGARVERGGPTFGFGVGLGLGSAGYRGRRGYSSYGGLGYDDAYGLDEPLYYAVIDPSDNTYWEWDGEGQARLTLVYGRAGDPGKTFTHAFVLRRRKA